MLIESWGGRMRNLDTAFAMAKQAQQSLYNDTCTIYRFDTITDEETHLTKESKVVFSKDIRCRISFSSISSAGNARTADGVAQSIKLFLDPEIVVPAGCIIAVTRQGQTTEYERSGVPSFYRTHQEVPLELSQRYA